MFKHVTSTQTRGLVIRVVFYQVDLGRLQSHEQGGKRFGSVHSPSDSPLADAELATFTELVQRMFI